MFADARNTTCNMVILPSKVNIPSLTARVLERPRILQKLERSLYCPLTTVVSAAGFGKTTAVLSWANSLPDVPVAWFLLDSEDCVLDRFWRYLIAAIRNADEAICHNFEEIQMSDSFEAMRPVIDEIILQIAEYSQEFICVLEDFHTVHEERDISESMLYFIKHLPLNAHVVITSRHPVRFPLAKMRIGGVLVEVTETDLKFTRAETSDFFTSNNIRLTKEEADTLVEVAQGWPTGNKLIELLCGEGSRLEIKEALELARESINDYLFEEVFADLRNEQQDFLLATSLVNSFCPSLAERITNCDQFEVIEIIDFLTKNDLFIERTEGAGDKEWFRYHLLFGDMLKQRLVHADRDRVAKTRRAARDWFDENGFLDYVVELSYEIGDYGKIKEVILRNWLAQYMADSHMTLLRWADFLPEEEVLKSPMLCAVLAMPVAVMGDYEKGNTYIRNAIGKLRDNEDFLFALCMAQKAYIYSFQNDSINMQLCAEKALRYFPEKEYYLRGMMFQVLAASSGEADPLHAKEMFMKAVETQCQRGNKNLSCSAYSNLACLCANLGHLDEAKYYVDLALGLYEEQERRFKPMLTLVYLTQMVCRYEQGDYTGVLDAYRLFEIASINSAISSTMAEAKSIKSKALYAFGGPEARNELFQGFSVSESGTLLAYPSMTMVKDYCEAFRTKALTQSKRVSKEAHIRLFDFRLAYLLGSDEHCDEVCEFASGLEDERCLVKIHALITASLYCERAARSKAAEAYLIEALERAKCENIRQPFIENRAYLNSTLARLANAARDDMSAELLDFVSKLIDRSTFSVSRLTDREIDVIRCIADGLTIADAAKAMFVSRDTVKKHLANIYTKLDVHSKMQAVALLREQGII